MKIDPSHAVLGEKLLRSQIFLMLLVISTMLGQTSGRESRKPTDPLGGSKTLSLNQLISVVLEHNPMIQSARAKWIAAREHIVQAGAWEDLKVGTNIVLGRFVSDPVAVSRRRSLTASGLAVTKKTSWTAVPVLASAFSPVTV
jgi:hypothetical protein